MKLVLPQSGALFLTRVKLDNAETFFVALLAEVNPLNSAPPRLRADMEVGPRHPPGRRGVRAVLGRGWLGGLGAGVMVVTRRPMGSKETSPPPGLPD